MAPQSHVYFDHYQTPDHQGEPLAIGGCTTLEKVYEYEPVPAELNSIEASHVLVAQGQLWTEYVPTPAHAQWMAYPCSAGGSPLVNQGPARFQRLLIAIEATSSASQISQRELPAAGGDFDLRQMG